MPRRSKRDIFDQASPTVRKLIASLRKSEDTEQADAVQAVLTLAEDAVRATEGQAELDAKLDKPFAIPVAADLWTRTEQSPNLTAEILDGWRQFLAGAWEPTQPVRAGHGAGVAKANVNLRAPRELIDQVEAAADRLLTDKGWSTARGYKLNARQVAAQWLALRFPAPPESEAAAE
jgi:hypothetical protein